MSITSQTVSFVADTGTTLEIKAFSGGLNPENHIIVLMTGWGCGDAYEYEPFASSLIASLSGATVLVPEFNETTPQLTSAELADRCSRLDLHPTQSQKQFVCEQLLGWAIREFHTAHTFAVIGYSEGSIHAILAAQKHCQYRQLKLVLVNPAGLATRASLPVILIRALRNALHNLYARMSNGSATLSRLTQHSQSVKRYLREYAGSGSAEGINAGQVDLRVEALMWATKQKTQIRLITCQNDAMIDLNQLRDLAQESPESFDLLVTNGIHSTLFTHPHRIITLMR